MVETFGELRLLSCKYGIRESEFVAKTKFLYKLNYSINNMYLSTVHCTGCIIEGLGDGEGELQIPADWTGHWTQGMILFLPKYKHDLNTL